MKLSYGSAFQQAGEKHTELELLKIGKEIGFSCYDLAFSVRWLTPDTIDANIEKWKRLFDEAEVKVTQTHAPFKYCQLPMK